MTRDDVGGTVVWSKLVHPSYRTIDLRTLLRDASQALPPPPFDVVHIVTAQDCVAVQLTIIEHPEPPPELAARTPTLSGAVRLPAGWLYIDPPAAPLPGHVDLSGPGEYAYAAYQDNGAETEAACRQTIGEHPFDDPYVLTAALDRYTGQERWTVHFWPAG
jgi:hypothetical protein